MWDCLIKEDCCRDGDSWADLAESTAKGQDRKFGGGGFSEALTDFSGFGESSNVGPSTNVNQSPAGGHTGE